MRLDHIAYRVKDKKKTAKFFIDAFGYRVQQEFQIDFPDGSKADCIALEPPEKVGNYDWAKVFQVEYATTYYDPKEGLKTHDPGKVQEYHLAPEIFVSDGSPGSIVGDWVAARGGIGGVHHMAYQVESVQKTMDEWKAKGYAEFATENPLTCPDDNLIQVFTKPSELTGIIIEFIERGINGFCKDNVQKLMESTKGC